jgi:hypothetical protein
VRTLLRRRHLPTQGEDGMQTRTTGEPQRNLDQTRGESLDIKSSTRPRPMSSTVRQRRRL